jgi:hypothetical protein
MKKIIFTYVLIFAMSSYAEDICRGQVTTGSYSRDVTIYLSSIEIGSRFSLASPITLDTEQEVEVQVVKSSLMEKSVLVQARYTQFDNSIMTFILKKDTDGRIHLLELQGHEDKQFFGPGHLICETRK